MNNNIVIMVSVLTRYLYTRKYSIRLNWKRVFGFGCDDDDDDVDGGSLVALF